MKTLIQIIIISLVFTGVLFMIAEGISRQEEYECAKWADQAKELSGFYYTDWQKDQCNIK